MWADRSRLLSLPVRLHWAGWETDTFRLQQAGWSLSAEQDFDYGRMRLAMRHEMAGMYGITETEQFPFEELAHASRGGRSMLETIGLRVRCMSSRIMTQFVEVGLPTFAAIDARPQLVERQIRSIEDFAHFAVPLARTREIILPEESVPELMERILKLQQPARTEEFRRQILEQRAGMQIDAVPEQRFHAQILSFARAA